MTVEGFDDFQRNIKKLMGLGGTNEVAGVVYAAAKIGRNIVRSKAKRGKTGNLKKGIVVGKFKKQNKLNPAAFIAIDYKEAPHAHLVEFGHALVVGDGFPGVRPKVDERERRKKSKKTKNRFGKPFKKIGHVGAKPFFRPGIRAAQGPMFNEMAKGAADALKKIKVER